MHVDGHPHVLDRRRIARGADRHQGIVGHPARPHPLVPIRWPRRDRRELLMGEAIDRPLMGGAVLAEIRDLRAPTLEPGLFAPPVRARLS